MWSPSSLPSHSAPLCTPFGITMVTSHQEKIIWKACCVLVDIKRMEIRGQKSGSMASALEMMSRGCRKEENKQNRSTKRLICKVLGVTLVAGDRQICLMPIKIQLPQVQMSSCQLIRKLPQQSKAVQILTTVALLREKAKVRTWVSWESLSALNLNGFKCPTGMSSRSSHAEDAPEVLLHDSLADTISGQKAVTDATFSVPSGFPLLSHYISVSSVPYIPLSSFLFTSLSLLWFSSFLTPGPFIPPC